MQNPVFKNQQQQEKYMKNSEQFEPDSFSNISEQHYAKPKKQQKYISGSNNGKWSEKENAKYIAYIQFHKQKMRSKEKRRVNKLYKQMARFIGTRNALQCRSHHQKLQDRYLYPNKIIANFKQHNDLKLYEQIQKELELYQNFSKNKTSNEIKQQQILLATQQKIQFSNQINKINKLSQDNSQKYQKIPGISEHNLQNQIPCLQYLNNNINWMPIYYVPMFSIL